MKPLLLAGMIILTLVVLVVAPFVGMTSISPESVIAAGADDPESRIFWSLRVPRVMLGFLAGASMSLAGMVFQAMFRNPLATPFTLGVSSGAALGATLYIRLGLSFAVFGVSGVTLSAFAGALLAISVVYGLIRSRPGSSTGTMLLAGVAVNFTFSSFILMVHYTSDMANSFNILRWLMGRLDTVGPDEPLSLLPLMVFGGLAALALHRELNLMSVGEEIAVGRGVDVSRYRKVLFLAMSVMIGGVVAICGPIGFVGMMAPHICRLVIGPDHRWLGPMSLLFGGVFLVVCDALSRVLAAPAELPVGVITALLGGPFFLWLLTGRRGASVGAGT
ncbi:iron ABC transporter permease [bacterium]|nr:iron ABC transporter permease [bacterium]MBU1072066.1 iron ABC transporter permease [bacterium]MBU1676977.1 iron ABC transporter permease [bacterium]